MIVLAAANAALLFAVPSVSVGQSLPQIDERGIPTIALSTTTCIT